MASRLVASRLFASSTRGFASSSRASSSAFPPLEKTMLKADFEAAEHAKKSTSFWKKFCFFIVAPAFTLTTAFVYKREMDHFSHWTPQEYQPWAHMRKRRSAYPWGDGDHTLFHNKRANPDPPADE